MMRTASLVAVLAALAAGALACAAAPDPLHKLRTRASFDLGCPEEQLHRTHLDERTEGVSGCGKRATYVKVCDVNDCTWVMNSDAHPESKSSGE
jgi:hypothetical protein